MWLWVSLKVGLAVVGVGPRLGGLRWALASALTFFAWAPVVKLGYVVVEFFSASLAHRGWGASGFAHFSSTPDGVALTKIAEAKKIPSLLVT